MDAFADCISLNSIMVDSENTVYDSRDNCNGIIETASDTLVAGCMNTTIPEDVVAIGEHAFLGCVGLRSFSIPKSVTNIGAWAFYGCVNLIRIEIPASVTAIGTSVFGNCNNLIIYCVPGSCAETRAESWHIPYIYTMDEAVIILDCDAYVYDGTAKTPSVTVMSGDMTFAEGTDYEVVYSDNVNTGTAMVTVTAKGQCEGTVQKTFSIEPRTVEDAKVTLSQKEYIYSGKENQPAVTVTVANTELKQDRDYTVKYKNNVEVGNATVVIEGIGNYCGKVESVYTIKEKISIETATIALSQSEYIYSGKANMPAVTVKIGQAVLKQDTDYTVAYENNVNVGTATITITGKGIYTGSKKVTFTIKKAPVTQVSIKGAKVTLTTTKYTYNGKAKKPGVTLKLGKVTLKKNTDYTISYKNNKNIGKATVTIKGKGKYIGTITKTFTISAKKGATFTYGSYKYKITSSSTVAFNGIKSTKTTKVNIPKTVKYGGKSFKVTSIADKALKNKTKVTSITISSNLTKIGKQAFYGCKKLKTITIKSTKLTSVGKQALKGIHAKATIKVPKSKLKNYKKLLKGKGQGSKVTIKKY